MSINDPEVWDALMNDNDTFDSAANHHHHNHNQNDDYKNDNNSDSNNMVPPAPAPATLPSNLPHENELRLLGSHILQRFPDDLHFVCGCAGFDPFGHNAILRELACDYFMHQALSQSQHCNDNSDGPVSYFKGKVQVRKDVQNIMQAAHCKAIQIATDKNNYDNIQYKNIYLQARFMVWKSDKLKLKECNWPRAEFRNITDNLGDLKKYLESPLRGAHGAAKERLLSATVATTGTTTGAEENMAAELLVVHPDKAPRSQQKRHSPSLSCVHANGNSSNNNNNDHDNMAADIHTIVQRFTKKYKDPEINDAMERLDYDRGEQNIEVWAKEFYLAMRKNPFDPRCKPLNEDRRKLLNLLYDMVNEWKRYNYSPVFEQAIADIFQERRLVAILRVCLPMDRAQALYRLRTGTNPHYGVPWFSELHCDPTSKFGREYPDLHAEWTQYIQENYATASPPMNKRLFRLLFSDILGLRKKHGDFQRWSMPAKPEDGEEPSHNNNNKDCQDDNDIKPPASKKLKPC